MIKKNWTKTDWLNKENLIINQSQDKGTKKAGLVYIMAIKIKLYKSNNQFN